VIEYLLAGRNMTEVAVRFKVSLSTIQTCKNRLGEEIIQQCIEVIRSEQKASVSLMQRRLRLGYTRAARIMDELEGRGIVGPSKGAEPRDILIDLDGVSYSRITDDLEDSNITVTSEGAEPTEYLVDFDYEKSDKPLIERPEHDIQAGKEDFAVDLCANCQEKIKVDLNEFDGRDSVVVICPHCRIEIQLARNADEA
jgi:hypothetical protein